VNPTRIGVIGAGHWSQSAHLPAIQMHSDASLVAIADPNRSNLARSVAKFKPKHSYFNHRDMLKELDLDAAVIAVPHRFHSEIARDCLSRGLHVLIEKPMTLIPEDADALVEMANESGLHLVVSYPWHYNEQCLWAKACIDTGRIGKTLFLSCFFGSTVLELYRGRPDEYPQYGAGAQFFGPQRNTYSDPRISGGGQGQTQLTHALALGLFITGLYPDRVSCLMSHMDTAVDVIDVVTMGFSDGALGSFGTTGAVRPSTHTDTLEYRVYGTDGHIHLDVSDGRAVLYDEQHSRGLEAPPLEERLRYPAGRPVENLIELANGRGQNQSPGCLGARVVHVLSAAYASAHAGGLPKGC